MFAIVGRHALVVPVFVVGSCRWLFCALDLLRLCVLVSITWILHHRTPVYHRIVAESHYKSHGTLRIDSYISLSYF